jgi:hypothetical protein
MSRQPKYTYKRRGAVYAIYEMTYYENSSHGTKIKECYTKEDASREVYRLNGWNSKNEK